MSCNFQSVIAVIFLILIGIPTAYSYKPKEHITISTNAISQSVLSSQTYLNNLGLLYAFNDDKRQLFPNTKGTQESILQLIQDGARFEDDSLRSLNHFYNPVNNEPLLAIGYTSPDWALEDRGQITSTLLVFDGQDFSYADAHQYLYDALTKTSSVDRARNFGLLFQTLGQVIHHIQDMAQPQHVRNDSHCDLRIPCVFPGHLLLSNPSGYEVYATDLGALPLGNYGAVYDPSADTSTFSIFDSDLATAGFDVRST